MKFISFLSYFPHSQHKVLRFQFPVTVTELTKHQHFHGNGKRVVHNSTMYSLLCHRNYRTHSWNFKLKEMLQMHQRVWFWLVSYDTEVKTKWKYKLQSSRLTPHSLADGYQCSKEISCFRLLYWRCRQQVPPKCWWPWLQKTASYNYYLIIQNTKVPYLEYNYIWNTQS